MKFTHIQQFLFFGLLLGTTGVFLWMLGSYLMLVFWAIVLAIVFHPLYQKFLRMFRDRQNIASLASILTVVLIVIIPLLTIGGLLVQESVSLYQQATGGDKDVSSLHLIERLAEFSDLLEPLGISGGEVENKVRDWGVILSQKLTSSLVSISQVTFSFLLGVAITFYLLFFFFRDGTKLQQTLMHYLPLNDNYEKRLFVRFTETTRAVVKGTLVIAIVQGFLGGLAFFFTGVSNPALWGVAMAFLAIIPALGPAFIWAPAGVLLLLSGAIWQGVTILIVGALLVSVIDEFLRPILVGRGAKMPDAVILLATIAGLTTFGISGIVVGPIIAAFFLSLWIMFEEKYHKELSGKS